jgi:hypothetical protein
MDAGFAISKSAVANLVHKFMPISGKPEIGLRAPE